MANTNAENTITAQMSNEEIHALYDSYFITLKHANLRDLKQSRKDLLMWRRGSAQLVLKINANLNNLSIYSVLITDVDPTPELYRTLLTYNTLQRREALGMVEREGKSYIVLKYTMELEVATMPVVQRHVFALQEIADQLDTELAKQFGGKLHFEDWEKMDQKSVDNLMESLFN